MAQNGSRIRVCFAVDASYAGGAERYIALIATGVDRRVFEPVVLAKTGAGLDGWCESLVSSGVAVVRAPMGLPFRAADAVPLFAVFLEIAPRVVHINMPGPYDGQMGLLAPLSRLAGCAGVLVTEHLPRVEWLWKRALVKSLSYRWVDRVLTVCRANVPHLTGRQRVPVDKVNVVYNGIPAWYGSGGNQTREHTRRELDLEGDTVGLVFVGSLIERKGLGILLEALTGLDGAGWRLFIIGTGDQQAAYRQTVMDKGLGERVRFLGSLSEKEVERVISATDVLALPSFMEGMPYVVLEAMACSLPVVATPVDGIPEAAPDGESALLVPPGDVAALRAALRRLIDDGSLRRELGGRGRLRFERLFTLDRHIAEMESVYVDVAAAGPLTTSGRKS